MDQTAEQRLARDQEDQDTIETLESIRDGSREKAELSEAIVSRSGEWWSFASDDAKRRFLRPCVFKAAHFKPGVVKDGVLVLPRKLVGTYYYVCEANAKDGQYCQPPEHMSNDLLIWDWRGHSV